MLWMVMLKMMTLQMTGESIFFLMKRTLLTFVVFLFINIDLFPANLVFYDFCLDQACRMRNCSRHLHCVAFVSDENFQNILNIVCYSISEARKKSKKKKLRRPRGIEKSSGDSDSQTMSEDQDAHDAHHYHHHHHHGDHHQVKKKEVLHVIVLHCPYPGPAESRHMTFAFECNVKSS